MLFPMQAIDVRVVAIGQLQIVAVAGNNCRAERRASDISAREYERYAFAVIYLVFFLTRSARVSNNRLMKKSIAPNAAYLIFIDAINIPALYMRQ